MYKHAYDTTYIMCTSCNLLLLVQLTHAQITNNFPFEFGQIGGSTCTSRDLSISQGLESGSGILPVYMVEIINTCESQSGCAPSNIHLHCGWFASTKLVNPNLFKRLSYDDCLVNNGQTMSAGQVIHFSYSSTSMYPISFKYATFC